MAKYKTIMGTPTDVPPSKERQYHIDAYKKSKSEALKKKTKIAPYSTERLPMSKKEYRAYMKDKYGE